MPQQKDTGQYDADLVRQFRLDPDRAIERIFHEYYEEVCRHIYRLIPVRETCQDIAQTIFLELWQKRRNLAIRTSIGAYLHKMALSRSLNYIRDNKKHLHDPEEESVGEATFSTGPLQQLLENELQQVVSDGIDRLPERCRLVFVLSRFENMSYKEISEALNISVKTVENQISKALEILRIAIREYDRGNLP